MGFVNGICNEKYGGVELLVEMYLELSKVKYLRIAMQSVNEKTSTTQTAIPVTCNCDEVSGGQ